METGTEWKLAKNRDTWGARQIGGKRKWISLRTKDKDQAELLFARKYGADVLPEENRKHLELGKAHLNLVDPGLTKHTWGDLYKSWANQKHLKSGTKERRRVEVTRGIFPLIKDKLLCDSTVQPLVMAWRENLGIYARETLRLIQNHGISLGWLMMPAIKPIHTKVYQCERRQNRAITQDEHDLILERLIDGANKVYPITRMTHGFEKHDYYQFLYLTGAAQSDGANMLASNINWRTKELVFHRQKTKERCAIAIAGALETLLRSLPKEGHLFPNMAAKTQNRRSQDFRMVRIALGLEGISLHSYRYWMAELFAKAGRPIRDAQIALGHSSKAVATAYAKHAKIAVQMPEAPQGATMPDIIDGASLVA
jgi:hypothetical protein